MKRANSYWDVRLPDTVAEAKEIIAAGGIESWEPTDEGSRWRWLEIDEDGGIYTAEFCDGGRDCDGTIETTTVYEGKVENGRIYWEVKGGHTYDQYAQAAGY